MDDCNPSGSVSREVLNDTEMLQRFFQKSKSNNRQVLTVAPGERIYAVGDIHGRCDLLLALLAKIYADATSVADDRQTRLVLLGDYIDRGDQSSKVLDALIALCEDDISGVTPLLGNHEAALLEFIADPVANPEWLRFGAKQTLASYGICGKSDALDPDERVKLRDDLRQVMGAHVTFLETLCLTAYSGNIVFAHAGLRASNAGDPVDSDAVLWGYPGFLTEQPVPGIRVVHGHYDNAQPISLSGRLCVDTGAYYSGVLTAVRLDEGETFLSVQSSSLL